jgi:predicted nucleotidyltransferase
MNPTDRAILEKFKSLLTERVRLHRMFLFGSRARGEGDRYSDMDVLVVLAGPCDQKTRNAVSDCAWEAGFEYGVVVVPVVFTQDEFEKGPERHSLLLRAVESEGISI